MTQNNLMPYVDDPLALLALSACIAGQNSLVFSLFTIRISVFSSDIGGYPFSLKKSQDFIIFWETEQFKLFCSHLFDLAIWHANESELSVHG